MRLSRAMCASALARRRSTRAGTSAGVVRRTTAKASLMDRMLWPGCTPGRCDQPVDRFGQGGDGVHVAGVLAGDEGGGRDAVGEPVGVRGRYEQVVVAVPEQGRYGDVGWLEAPRVAEGEVVVDPAGHTGAYGF